MTINLSRFQEFARENLGLGLLGGAGTVEVNIEIFIFFVPPTDPRQGESPSQRDSGDHKDHSGDTTIPSKTTCRRQ